MTKRYFYTDALAAAWMAKHFGVKFVDIYYPDPLAVYDICDFVVNTADGPYDNIDKKFYLHPDSLAILEPQAGDVAECAGFTWADSSLGFVVEDQYGDNNNQREHYYLIPIENIAGGNRYKIILRNGKAFFTPEVEEV